MSEIRLENVTKVFKPGRWFSSRAGGTRRTYGGYEDKAFVERVAGSETQVGAASGPVHALDHLDLTVEDGETMAIVGPSGCGKSTLLRVVAGLETQDEGDVYYDDENVNDVKPKDRGIGMVFQSYALYPHMKGEGNLGFFFRVRKRAPEEMMERIRITSEIMGIGFEALLDRKPGTLSGGQQQRVAIGRCIVRDPRLFLFDEPLSNLDAKLRTSTRIEIKRLLHRFHITSLYVTHDQTEAITLGDRIAVMRAGKMEQIGTYHEITTNPVNAFVAEFLGLPPMNLLRGWRADDRGGLVSDYGHIGIPTPLVDLVAPNQGVIVGFRSEGATVVPEGAEMPADGLAIGAEVINAEPNFARHTQVVNVQAADMIFGVTTDLDLHVNPGWRVNVVIPEAAAYLFDEETEARIARAVEPTEATELPTAG